MSTRFALVDCNNFYACCERVFNPRLIGKPLAILSNNDGRVIARCEEVKQLGVPMGAVAHEHKETFHKNGVNVNMSRAVAEDLEEHERRIVEHDSGAQQFERYCIRTIAQSLIKAGKKDGWVAFGKVEEH